MSDLTIAQLKSALSAAGVELPMRQEKKALYQALFMKTYISRKHYLKQQSLILNY